MTILHYTSYPLLAAGIENGTEWYRDGDAGVTQPLGEDFASGYRQDKGSAVVSSLRGSKLWSSSGRHPTGVPARICPSCTSPGAQPSQHGTRFVPRCNTPLPASCVTPLPTQRAGAAARPRPGLASTVSSSPPQLLANPAHGGRSPGVTPGSHGVAVSRGSVTVAGSGK